MQLFNEVGTPFRDSRAKHGGGRVLLYRQLPPPPLLRSTVTHSAPLQLNARRLYNEVNCLEGVFGNPIFVGIWVVSAFVQVLLPLSQK